MASNSDKRLKTSVVWKHYHDMHPEPKAKCRLCSVLIRTVGGSTSGLWAHMRNAHKKVKLDENGSGPTQRQTTLMAYHKGKATLGQGKYESVTRYVY